MVLLDVLQTLHALIAEPLERQASVFLEEPAAAVRSGVDVALPNLLGAIAQVGTTPDGVEWILRVLRMPMVDPGLLARDPEELFRGGKQTQALIETGAWQLAILFGSRPQAFNDALAAMTGLGFRGAASLSAMVTPFIFAALKRDAQIEGVVDARSVGYVLDGVRERSGGKVSSHLLALLGVGAVADWLGVDVAREKAAAAARQPVPGVWSLAPAGERIVMPGGIGLLQWAAVLTLVMVAALAFSYWQMRAAENELAPPPSSAAPASGRQATAVASTTADGQPRLEVCFGEGSAALPQGFVAAAAGMVEWLASHPLSRAMVFSGHAPAVSDPLALDAGRADAIRSALETAGVDRSQIVTGGRAEASVTGSGEGCLLVQGAP